MTDTENEKPDAEAEAETGAEAVTEAESKPAPSKKKPSPRKRRLARRRHAGIFFSFLILVIMLALAAGIFYLWKEQQDHFSQSRTAFSQLRSNFDELNQQQQQQQQQLVEQLNTLNEQQSNLKDAFNSLLKTSSHLRNDWLLTEAEYLIKLANHRLLLERDINTAIVALQAADQRLHEVADPGLLKMRKRIADDINALRAVPQADVSGMSFEISALSNDINQLPLATPDPESMAKRASEQHKTQVDNWRDLPAAVWQDLKSLVVIRHHDQPLQPLLSPEQRFFLTQNLQLKLEEARLALLKGQSKLFKERLQQTIEWINTYFDINDDLTKHVLNQLQELSGKNIHPELPDISTTYQALRDYRVSVTQGIPQPTETPAAEPKQDSEPAETTEQPNSKPAASSEQDKPSP